MPKYIKDKKIIQATKRAYEVVYKSQGFAELKFIEDIEEAHQLAIKENEIKSLEDKKVDELKDLARKHKIGYGNLKKEELIKELQEALEGD